MKAYLCISQRDVMPSERQEPPFFELFHYRRLFRERRANVKPCQADKETKHTTTIQICFVEGGRWLWWGAGQVGALDDTLHLICSHWTSLVYMGWLSLSYCSSIGRTAWRLWWFAQRYYGILTKVLSKMYVCQIDEDIAFSAGVHIYLPTIHDAYWRYFAVHMSTA